MAEELPAPSVWKNKAIIFKTLKTAIILCNLLQEWRIHIQRTFSADIIS
ncbi:MAG: hypothetical protein IKI10_07975 [Muribaculaceae bacterium]|nr:hypothetical protein [Muribaculaceae bacterium]